MVEIKVPLGAGRVARFLRKKFPNLQYSTVQKALREKDIKLNGKRLTDDVSLLEGDILQIYLPDAVIYGRPKPDIVYEDENIVVVNKRQGIEVVGQGDTLQSDVAAYLDAPVFPCHRLDAKTGGLVIFAKNKHAYSEMLNAFRQHYIKKTYRCIVRGCPKKPAAELNAYLVKDSRRSTVKIFDRSVPGSVPIITRYKVLRSKDDCSLLEVDLVTGRTHQITAHMAHVGHPLLGNDKYGDRAFNKKYNVRNQCLWAIGLRFRFPKKSSLSYLNTKNITTDHYKFPIEI